MSTLTGIDILVRDKMAPLRGHRIGLITNHTGLTADGRSTIDILHQAPEVELRALFAPEHGSRGDVDEKVADSRDQRTGLPVHSLYGESYHPRPQHLQGLDTLVFDIQDIGCRFYTYISTLGHAMEAAAAAGIFLAVLDRPNPINGIDIEGPVSDPDLRSFTAWHSIPVRHGMTVGELARLFNTERKIGARLTVVRCEGWRRSEWFDATGLTWTNPSPNMRSLTQATLYPGVGLLEFTNLSVGRGTDTPFELIGAPWLDGRRLAAHLNDQGLVGAKFVPVRFTPRASVYAGTPCGGVNLLVLNRDRLRPVRMGLHIAAALRDLFPGDWNPARYDRLLADRRVFEAFVAGAAPGALESLWQDELGAFRRARRAHLLYD